MASASRLSARRDPLMLGREPLDFDNVDRDNLLELTHDEICRDFLSRWMEAYDPYVIFKRLFDRLPDKGDRLLHDVKIRYKFLVISEEWTEDKFVAVINGIMETQTVFSPKTLERFGEMYDQSRLPSQLRRRRKNGRRA